jgi:hypothetical protein
MPAGTADGRGRIAAPDAGPTVCGSQILPIEFDPFGRPKLRLPRRAMAGPSGLHDAVLKAPRVGADGKTTASQTALDGSGTCPTQRSLPRARPPTIGTSLMTA